MTEAFTAILTWTVQELPEFLVSSPAVYFIAFGLLVGVVKLVASLVRC